MPGPKEAPKGAPQPAAQAAPDPAQTMKYLQGLSAAVKNSGQRAEKAKQLLAQLNKSQTAAQVAKKELEGESDDE